MFTNLRKECFLKFLGSTSISIIISGYGDKCRMSLFVADLTSAFVSREYPRKELLLFCDTYFKGMYQVCDIPEKTIKDTSWRAAPITLKFLQRNFNGDSSAEEGISSRPTIFATRRGQTAISVDVFFRGEGNATVVIYGQPCDNVLNVHKVGELITFLNLCGLNEFVTTLRL